MKKQLTTIACTFIILLSALTVFAADDKPVIREERPITIDGIQELWRLEWRRSPVPVCGPEGDEWYTCPCMGFAFGEGGELDLVRIRPGHKDERLPLSPFFNTDFSPTGSETSQAFLRRWETRENDFDDAQKPGFAEQVRKRPVVKVMTFGDYDHDGRATEFLLQIGTLPCGKRISIIVGISRSNPRLHVFSSTKHPKQPLILQAQQWEVLRRAKGSIKVTDWPCGDHGSEEEQELELVARNGSIQATRYSYSCTDKGRGVLIRKEDF